MKLPFVSKGKHTFEIINLSAFLMIFIKMSDNLVGEISGEWLVIRITRIS